MKKILLAILSFASFLALIFFINYYIIYRMFSLFELYNATRVIRASILLTLSMILSTAIVKKYYNPVTKSFYVLSMTWMGISFLLISTLLIFEIIKFIFPLPRLISGIIILIFVSALTVYSIFHARKLKINNIKIPIKNLKKKLKIVQLSDIHIGAIHRTPFLEKIVRKTNELNPDIVVITGDLFDGSSHLEKNIFKHVNEIKAPIYFVIGNHEVYEGLDKVMEILKEIPVKVLRNEIAETHGIQIIGLDHSADKNFLKNQLSIMKLKKSPKILLYHEPISIEDSAKFKINLHLAGHLHGGQVFPFQLLERIVYKYIKGLHKYKNTYLYISQGSGDWGPPMRLFSNREITVFELEKMK